MRKQQQAIAQLRADERETRTEMGKAQNELKALQKSVAAMSLEQVRVRVCVWGGWASVILMVWEQWGSLCHALRCNCR